MGLIVLAAATLIAVVVLASWRLGDLKGKTERDVRNLIWRGDWLLYRKALRELRRRGLDISAEAPTVVELLSHESRSRRMMGWDVVRDCYPDYAALLTRYDPREDPAMCHRKLRESLPENAIITLRLDYSRCIRLDAEDLAEGDIGQAYLTRVLPVLRQCVLGAAPIEEVVDHVPEETERYAVTFGDRELVVYSPDIPGSDVESWGRAAYVLFTIVNDQLASSTHRFYALGGGNDLEGIFLTPTEAEVVRRALPNKADWPYLPTLEHEWYGQHHD